MFNSSSVLALYHGCLDPCRSIATWPSLRTPRLASPRPRVPAGSIGIGGEHTGIYPIESPAGWNIIGHTSVSLFDRSRQEEDESAMFLLKPGDRVRFVRT